MPSKSRSLRLESLESRRLLAVVAFDDHLVATENRDLIVGESDAPALVRFETVATMEATGGHDGQVEYAAAQNRLAVFRTGRLLEIFNSSTNELVSSLSADQEFVAMDFTNDHRYLFVLDNGGEPRTDQDPIPPSWLHRYNVFENVWERQPFVTYARSLVALSADRILVQTSQYVPSPVAVQFPSSERANVEAFVVGASQVILQDYNPITNRVYVGSGPGFYSVALEGDAVRNLDSSGWIEAYRDIPSSLTVSPDGMRVYFGQQQYDALDLSNHLQTFPENIQFATNVVAFGATGYYDAHTGLQLGEWSSSQRVVAVSDDGSEVLVSSERDGRIFRWRQLTRGVGLLKNDDATASAIVELMDEPQHGEMVSWAGDGTFRYRPTENYVGKDTFRYRIRESGFDSEATVTIDIAPRDRSHHTPVASDQTFFVDAGATLTVSAETGHRSIGMVFKDQIAGWSGVDQIEYSQTRELLFLRHGSGRLSVVDAVTGDLLETRIARTVFRDMDLSPSGRYLYVSDASDEFVPPEKNRPANWIHRYDLQTQEWQTKTVSSVATSLEVIADDQLVYLAGEGLVDVTLISFEPLGLPIKELSRFPGGYRGDLEYDAVGQVIYYGSNLAAAFRIVDQQLVLISQADVEDARQGVGVLTLDAEGNRLYVGGLELTASNLQERHGVLREPILAARRGLAMGPLSVFSSDDGQQIYRFPHGPHTVHLADGGRSVWIFDAEDNRLRHYQTTDVAVGLLAQATDLDADSLVVDRLSGPQHGEFMQFTSDGQFQYVPHDGFSGEDSFLYRVYDGVNYSEPAKVTIRVSVVDPSPSGALVANDVFRTTVNEPLTVTAPLMPDAAVSLKRIFAVEVQGEQVAASNRFRQVAVRGATEIEVVDATNGDRVGRHAARSRFVDMQVSPDERYLFVVDHDDNFGRGVDEAWVHRYDFASRTWIMRRIARDADRIDVIDGRTILLIEGQLSVETIMLVDFDSRHFEDIDVTMETSAAPMWNLQYNPRDGLYYSATSTLFPEMQVSRWTITRDGLSLLHQHVAFDVPVGDNGRVTVASDGTTVYFGPRQVEAGSEPRFLRAFPEDILSATDRVAFGRSSYYDAQTAEMLGSLPVGGEATVTADGRHLWVISDHQLAHYVLERAQSGVLANDYPDIPGIMKAELLTGPLHGNLQFQPSGEFIYLPEQGFHGTDTFAYRVVDPTGVSSLAVVEILVGQPPEAVPRFPTDRRETDLPLGLDGSASVDPEGASLTYEWSILEKPEGSLAAIEQPQAMVTQFVPDIPGFYTIGLQVDDGSFQSRLQFFTLSVELGFSSWHQTNRPLDVDASGNISPRDALLVINELNLRRYSQPGSSHLIDRRPEGVAYLDVNGDAFISPIDAMLVINQLNQSAIGSDLVVAAAIDLAMKRKNGLVAQRTQSAV